jgi:hypothetical protein
MASTNPGTISGTVVAGVELSYYQSKTHSTWDAVVADFGSTATTTSTTTAAAFAKR